MSRAGPVAPRQAAPRRVRRAAGLAALLLLPATACVTLRRAVASYDIAPNGLAAAEDRIRRALAAGSYDSALTRSGRRELGAPGDRLLRNLYGGLVAYYAGDYARSTAAFERAELIVDDRVTRSVTKEATSLVTNDRALPFIPAPTEQLLARHYAMLAYLQRGDTTGALVEARRLVLLLQQLEDRDVPVARETRALLHYVAGVVFEAGGERGDAEVAWRNAARFGLDAAPVAKPGDDSATVLVLVEHGFVAHRVEQSLTIAFGSDEEFAGFASAEARKKARHGHEEQPRPKSRGRADSVLVERTGTRTLPRLPLPASGAPLPGPQSTQPPVTPRAGDRGGPAATSPATVSTSAVAVVGDASAAERLLARVLDRNGDAWYVDRWTDRIDVRTVDDATYVLTFTWPAYARPEPAARPVVVRAVDGEVERAHAAPLHVASVSDAVVADFRRQRPAIFARALARAATKYYLSEQAEKKEKWAGILANAAGDLLERADTRSWQLLPGEIALVRLRVPAGTHALDVEVAEGTRRGARVDLGQVTLRPGELALVSGRVWQPRLGLPAAGPDTTRATVRTRR